MKVPIEDFFEDVLGKAQRGLGYSTAQVAEKAGVPAAQAEALLRGEFDPDAAEKVAAVLGLHAPTLAELARFSWRPEEKSLDGLAFFNTAYGDMLVNSFLIWEPETGAAAIFDSGADASPLIAAVREKRLRVEAIFLTHAHPDHIADLPRLRRETGHPPVYAHQNEPRLTNTETFREGRAFGIDSLTIETRLTSGHSAGGVTYVVLGLEKPVAVVGDALFCCSMGGGQVSFPDALENNRRHILTLPDETILCPGHGPLTTVGEEKAHNPFFPEWKG